MRFFGKTVGGNSDDMGVTIVSIGNVDSAESNAEPQCPFKWRKIWMDTYQ